MVKDWPQLRQETSRPAKRSGALCRLPHAGQLAEIGMIGILGVGGTGRFSRRMAYQSQPIGRCESAGLLFPQLRSTAADIASPWPVVTIGSVWSVPTPSQNNLTSPESAWFKTAHFWVALRRVATRPNPSRSPFEAFAYNGKLRGLECYPVLNHADGRLLRLSRTSGTGSWRR